MRIKIWNYFSQLGEDKIQKRLAEALNGYEKQEEERKTVSSLENNTEKNTLAVLLGLRATNLVKRLLFPFKSVKINTQPSSPFKDITASKV